MAKPDLILELETDEDGDCYLITRRRECLGHVSECGPLVPDELEEDYQAELERYEDGQRAAIGAREAAEAAYHTAVGTPGRAAGC